MNARRFAVPATLLALLLVPTDARALDLALESDRSCYGHHQMISLTGYGFTPDSDVALSAGGLWLGVGVADYDGLFKAKLRAPALPFALAELRFTAVDQTYRLNRASTDVRLTSLGVRVASAPGDPSQPRRIRARGFFDGDTLYAHVRRGDRVRNVRVGRLRGACRRIDVARRLFPPGVDPGAYRLHFDTSPRFYRGGAGLARVTYAVEIVPRAIGAHARAAGAGHTERWRLLSP